MVRGRPRQRRAPCTPGPDTKRGGIRLRGGRLARGSGRACYSQSQPGMRTLKVSVLQYFSTKPKFAVGALGL